MDDKVCSYKIRDTFVVQNVNDKIAIIIDAAIVCNNVMNNIKLK